MVHAYTDVRNVDSDNWPDCTDQFMLFLRCVTSVDHEISF